MSALPPKADIRQGIMPNTLMLACLLRVIGNTSQDVRYGQNNMTLGGRVDLLR